MSSTTSKNQLFLVNEWTEPIKLVLEPWGEEWTIEPGRQIQLSGEGPENEARFEVHFKPAVIVITGWVGSTVNVLQDGQLLPSASQAIPAI